MENHLKTSNAVAFEAADIGQRSIISIMAKRSIDLLIGIPLFFTLLPVFLLLAIAIKLDSPGPVLFIQDRRGLGFRRFRMMKFRTLRHNQPDPHARYEMLERDPRITAVGNFLRKTSLDELPQLFNVIWGTMSLVGPRPLVEWESQESLPKYQERYNVKPGITGLSQINGRNAIDFDTRCEWDVVYAREWTPISDLIIIAKTPYSLLKAEEVYPLPGARL